MKRIQCNILHTSSHHRRTNKFYSFSPFQSAPLVSSNRQRDSYAFYMGSSCGMNQVKMINVGLDKYMAIGMGQKGFQCLKLIVDCLQPMYGIYGDGLEPNA